MPDNQSSPTRARRSCPVCRDNGSFYPAYVQYAGTTNRAGRRRVLCFLTVSGVIGASASFSRAEAQENAHRAERGMNTFTPGANPGDTIKNYLRSIGFPVRSANDELDDHTAEHLRHLLT